jgi:hypothetical protein
MTERPLHNRRATVATGCVRTLKTAQKTPTVATGATVGSHARRGSALDSFILLQLKPSRRFATASATPLSIDLPARCEGYRDGRRVVNVSQATAACS